MRMFQLLATEPRFLRLWLGQCVSQAGDWFQLVALVSLLPARGTHVGPLAALFVVRFLGPLLFTPIAGVVADRLPRKAVMIVADVLRAGVVLGYLFAHGPEDIGLITALCFTQEALGAFFETARGAAIPQVVPAHKLYEANTLGSATWSAMLAFGAVLGGGAVAAFGREAAFFLNAGSFLLSGALVASVRIPKVVHDVATLAERAEPLRLFSKRGIGRLLGLDDFLAGARYLRAHVPQASVSFAKGGIGIVAAAGYMLISVFAEQIFVRDARPALATGCLYATRGVGSLIGPFIGERIFGSHPAALRRGVSAAYLLAALGFAAFAFAPTLAWAVLAYGVATCATSAVWVNSTQLLQLTVENRFLGRVLAVEMSMLSLVLIVTTLGTSGALEAAVAPRVVGYGVAAAGLVPFAFSMLVSARMGKRLDEAAHRELGRATSGRDAATVEA